MQSLPSKGLQRLLGPGRQPARLGFEAGAVGGVAQKRMAGMRQMDPDLVGAPGLEAALDQARYRFAVLAVEALQHLPVGDGVAPATADRHAVATLRMPVDRLVDGALGARRRAPDERQIAAPQRAGAAVV